MPGRESGFTPSTRPIRGDVRRCDWEPIVPSYDEVGQVLASIPVKDLIPYPHLAYRTSSMSRVA